MTHEEHLSLLSIFHYIVGAITAFLSCMPFLYLAMGIAMLSGAFDGKNAPPPFLGWFFIIFASFFIISGWILSILMIIAGRKLKKHTSHTFCLVIAGIECLLMPFGTILGIFTIITLIKDSVKQLFTTKS